MSSTIEESLRYWIPFRASVRDSNLLFNWLYCGQEPFDTPFFEDMAPRLMKFPENTSRFKGACNASQLTEWAGDIDSIEPTAFIFHISRCGSTLVSQALGKSPENISVSEVPVFDSILRLCYKEGFDKVTINSLLKAAMKFYGAKRRGTEEKLFIKADSWHIFFYTQLRELFPNTPMIILYRNPAEVLHSHQKRMGSQGVYGIIEPELFGAADIPGETRLPSNYMPFILNKYFNTIIGLTGSTNPPLLLNYAEGLMPMMEKIAAFTNTPLTPELRANIAERGLYHSKYPNEKFAEIQPDSLDGIGLLPELMRLYGELDGIRLKADAGAIV